MHEELWILFYFSEAVVSCTGSWTAGNVIGLVIGSFFYYECGDGSVGGRGGKDGGGN
jgi:hypothetical protein